MSCSLDDGPVDHASEVLIDSLIEAARHSNVAQASERC